jgi:hypothetical protein
VPAAPEPPVVLDQDGLLRRGTRWVAVPAGMLLVVQLLLDQLGSTVPLEQVIAAYAACGGTAHRKSVRTALGRLGRRIAPLGLELESIGQRAVRLRADPAAPG